MGCFFGAQGPPANRKDEVTVIIDFHCHIGKSKVFYPRESGSARDIVELMDRRGIDKVVLFPASTLRKPKRYYEDVVEAVKKFPDRFIGFFRANPKDERVCDMLEMVVKVRVQGAQVSYLCYGCCG